MRSMALVARLVRSAIPFTLSIWLCVGCSSDPSEPDSASNSETSQLIQDAGKVEPGPEYDETEPGGDPFLSDDGDTRYVPVRHQQAKNVKDILDLGANDGVIWPGQLLYGSGVSSFFYDDIPIARGPVTISLNVEGAQGTPNLATTVTDPTLSTLRQAISDVLTGVSFVPAAANFTYESVYSEDHLSLALSADASIGTVDLSSRYDFSSSTIKSRIVAKYQQVYFSVDVDRPISPAAFIKSGATVDELKAAFPDGSMPMYVAGVKYGWMAVMVIESQESEQATALALSAASSGVYDTQVTASLNAEQLLRSAKIEAYVYGGSTAQLGSLYTGFDGFVQVIESSANFGPNTPGVPLVYTFANMSDNTNAVINMAADYVVNTPVRLRQNIRLTLDSYYCATADDGVGDSTLEIDRLSVHANGFNIGSDPNSNLLPQAQAVASYSSGGDGWRATTGATWDLTTDNTLDLSFNTDPDLGFDLNNASIVFSGYARDYDCCSSNEDGSATLTVTGNTFFDNDGKHVLVITSSDFDIRANIVISEIP